MRARVVQSYLNDTTLRGKFALWAFGYDMSKAKARCWYEATFPLFDINQANTEQQDALAQVVQWLLSGAELAAMYLRLAIRNVWAGNGELRGDLGFVETSFWSNTERAFFEHVEEAVKLVKTAAANAIDASVGLRQSWLRTMQTATHRLFDEFAAGGDVESSHPERLGEAHRGLMKQLHGEKLHEALGLVKPEPSAGARKVRKSSDGSSRRKRGAPGGELTI
jgi:CRISPR system Cascade subunit CasA